MLGNVYTLITILILCKSSSTKNISFDIVDGKYARIVDFPYVAYIISYRGQRADWSCGASILNQHILLTAAHCVIDSDLDILNNIVAYTGHANGLKGKPSKVSDRKTHENYNSEYIGYDIALLILEKELEFGRRVRRVVLMSRPPFEEGAEIAGWGRTSEWTADVSYLLKYTKQRVLLREICEAQICDLPPDCICARHRMGFAHSGDSGSALVVRRYIQIGIANFISPIHKHKITVYANVSYYLPWIRKAARELYCARYGNTLNEDLI